MAKQSKSSRTTARKTAKPAKSAKVAKSAKPAARAATKKVAKSASAKPKAATPKKKAAKKSPAKPATSTAAKRTSKATKESPAKPAAKRTTKKAAKKPATRATAKATSARKPAKATATKVAKAAKKTSKRAPAQRHATKASKPDLDVKMPVEGSVARTVKQQSSGPGLSFLSGKPGSSGASDDVADDRPRLTKTKLGQRDLAKFRDLLIHKRRQLLGDMEGMEKEALQGEGSNLSHLPVHMADMGTDNYEQEFTLGLVSLERKTVDEIDHALKKIDDKTYGICEGTGQMIAKTRLEAQPWVRYSIEYANQLARRHNRR